jgi:hypothetical protein
MFTLCLESASLLIPAGVDPKVNVAASWHIRLHSGQKKHCEEVAVKVYLQLI